MDFLLNDEQRAVQKLAFDFAQNEIAPQAREHDEQGTINWDAFKKMGPLGLLGGPIPEEYGGAGFDYIYFGLICEELERAVFFTSDPYKPQRQMGPATRANFAGCAFCHEVKPLANAAPVIPKPILVDRWMPQARFDHAKHASVKCDDCHHATQRESGELLDEGAGEAVGVLRDQSFELFRPGIGAAIG